VNQEVSWWAGRAELSAPRLAEAAKDSSREAAGSMILGAWRRSWLAYSFDRYGGDFSRRVIRLGEHLPISGFGAIEKTLEHGRLFFSLYRWGGRIWFQAGDRSWRLDTADLRLGYRSLPGGRVSEFAVIENARISFRCSYANGLRGLFARAGEAGDNVDCEGRHFLAHVAGQHLPMLDSEAWHDGKASCEEESAESLRQGIRDHLQRLTDRFRRDPAPEPEDDDRDSPAELFYSWLEDSYRPTSVAFQQAFAPHERERLKRFTAVLQTASWEIGEEAEGEAVDSPQPTSAPIWTRVLKDAEETLADLAPTLPARH
jgi:hypothetical protein